VRKKVMKAVTDSGPTEPNQEKPQAIENIFQLMKAVSAPETLQFFEEQYNTCQIRYGDMKKQLAADMIAFTTPIYEKILELRSNNDYLRKIAKQGAEKARESATKTVREVREIIGIRSL
jgi:tryptophanyl-tRNA synthetase